MTLLDARDVLVCRRLAYQINKIAFRDWSWDKYRWRYCRVMEGPL